MIAGTGEAGFSGDGGKAMDAKLNSPTGWFFSMVISIFPIPAIIGCGASPGATSPYPLSPATGRPGYTGDGGPAVNASLDNPQGLEF